jgi:hypothetical protein
MDTILEREREREREREQLVAEVREHRHFLPLLCFKGVDPYDLPFVSYRWS